MTYTSKYKAKRMYIVGAVAYPTMASAKAACKDGQTVDVFDSTKEYRRWYDLCMMADAGQITHLERQVPYYIWAGLATEPLTETMPIQLPKRFQYRLDFQYFDVEKQCMVYEDVKGVKTPMYKLKKALTETSYGITITEIS